MFGSGMLEVAIGLFFIFFILSLVCSALREAVESFTKTRAAQLQKGVTELLRDPDLVRAVYTHPLLSGLYAGEYPEGKKRSNTLPSYIPAGNFALALLDIAARGADYLSSATTGPTTPVFDGDAVRSSLTANIPDGRVRRLLLLAIDRAEGDMQRAQTIVEAWFDSSMDRVSGWYKRQTQLILFILGLAVSVVLNANTLAIATYLYEHDDARAALVAQADAFSTSIGTTAAIDSLQLDRLTAEVSALQDSAIPFGWSEPWPGYRRAHPDAATWSRIWIWEWLLTPLLGWLATALAITLGAPFWFDVLNKVMVIRSTVKPHEKSAAEGSEDRQPKGGASHSTVGGTREGPGPEPSKG